MKDKFVLTQFSECDITDNFFDSLREDYEGFNNWFNSHPKREAYVFKTDDKIKAFLCIKDDESEEIQLIGKVLPKVSRVKICTLKLSADIEGQRLGEGAIGIALWHWQRSSQKQIYLTIFDKHKNLISLIERFGFINAGRKSNDENVYIKDKTNLRYENPYLSFPYISKNFEYAGYIPIEDQFHDTLFPYSELYNTNQDMENIAAANGMTKIFIATPFSYVKYYKNEPVFIYRKHTGLSQRGYKSVVTSYCVIVEQIIIKNLGKALKTKEEYLKIVGNKSVYSKDELERIYLKKDNIIVLAMVYNGYFGKGNNVNWVTLKSKGLFGKDQHPYQIQLNKTQFEQILKEGRKNVQDIIID